MKIITRSLCAWAMALLASSSVVAGVTWTNLSGGSTQVFFQKNEVINGEREVILVMRGSPSVSGEFVISSGSEQIRSLEIKLETIVAAPTFATLTVKETNGRCEYIRNISVTRHNLFINVF